MQGLPSQVSFGVGPLPAGVIYCEGKNEENDVLSEAGMKLPFPPRRGVIAVTVLLATNIVTGLVCAHTVHTRDFSDMNMAYLLTWGMINQRFEEAQERKLTGIKPKDEAQIYYVYEDTARFNVHYSKFCKTTGLDKNDAQVFLAWGVAADRYRRDNVNIQVDPAVWKAFLAEGPKDLPLYWGVRESLEDAGAGQGLIRGEDPMHGMTNEKPTLYKLSSFPHQPLPRAANPS